MSSSRFCWVWKNKPNNKQGGKVTENSLQQDVLLHEQHGHIGLITFNRPEQRNALSPQLLRQLCKVLADWAACGEIRVVIFTGAGDKAFSAGYDIGAIETVGPGHKEKKADGGSATPFEQALREVRNFPYPTIAMINGHCFGGALHLALCCDLRIAADHISMGMPPARLGVVYGPDGLLEFIQVLGSARARELLFTGRPYRGQEIIEMGLVRYLVPGEALENTVFALANEIAANAPLALKGMKRIMNMVEAPDFSDELKAEARKLVAEGFASADLKEGQRAFLEKRKPVFTGK
ncbi:MAG TPA: enoyl-CoA hydratase [Porticoccaceae bacterium]|nr:enoyl-CoA hydratase [Porticoccaceae bacterium]